MPKADTPERLFFSVQVSPNGLTLDARLTRDHPPEVLQSAGVNGVAPRNGSAVGQGRGVLSRSWSGRGKGRRRRARGDRTRSKTIAPRRLTQAEIHDGQRLSAEEWLAKIPRPKTRRDCWTAQQALEQMGYDDGRGDGCNAQRPCPFVTCRRHPYLDVNPETGSIKLNFPHLQVWELPVTCALDVAEDGGDTLEGVGHGLNLTRERIRQVEVRGLLNLKLAGVDTDKLCQALDLKDRLRGGVIRREGEEEP